MCAAILLARGIISLNKATSAFDNIHLTGIVLSAARASIYWQGTSLKQTHTSNKSVKLVLIVHNAHV